MRVSVRPPAMTAAQQRRRERFDRWGPPLVLSAVAMFVVLLLTLSILLTT